MKRGFTLIELLIVIAIILILIAIALPNFLESQIRAKVARAAADMRHLGIAVEAYALDQKQYPNFYKAARHGPNRWSVPWYERLIPITTPVKYLTPIPQDPFRHEIDENKNHGFMDNPLYLCYIFNRGDTYTGGPKKYGTQVYMFNSAGPDNNIEIASYWSSKDVAWLEETKYPAGRYNPTNGTVSRGDIFHWAP